MCITKAKCTSVSAHRFSFGRSFFRGQSRCQGEGIQQFGLSDFGSCLTGIDIIVEGVVDIVIKIVDAVKVRVN